MKTNVATKMRSDIDQPSARGRASKARSPLQKMPAPVGRPTDYSIELADELCLRVASGRSIKSVSEDPDMPAWSTIYRWRQANEEFRSNLVLAREVRLEHVADTMVTLGLRAVASDRTQRLEPNAVRAAVDAFDKAARIMKDHKVTMEVTSKDRAPNRYDLSVLSDDELEQAERIVRKLSGD